MSSPIISYNERPAAYQTQRVSIAFQILIQKRNRRGGVRLIDDLKTGPRAVRGTEGQ